MSVIDSATFDEHVGRGDTTVATILIFTTLEADGIVANVEAAIDEKHVGAGFNVYAVAILSIPRVADIDIVNYEIFAKKRMHIQAGEFSKVTP